jgi:hypothetical protein
LVVRVAVVVRSSAAPPARNTHTAGESIDSIIAFSKGFVCGGAGGTLRIFERSDDVREYYKCAKIFTIEGHRSKITNLAISPSEVGRDLGMTRRIRIRSRHNEESPSSHARSSPSEVGIKEWRGTLRSAWLPQHNEE